MRPEYLYYLFLSLVRLGMFATVTAYVPFLMSLGLSLGEIALVNAVYWAVVMLAEVPTGMLADGRGRAWSLKMGALVSFVGAALYMTATGLYSAMFAEAVIAIGTAFLSGADSAWLADALTRAGRAQTLRRAYATAGMWSGAIGIVGGIAGALLALQGYRFIWVVMMVTAPLAWALAHYRMNHMGEAIDPLTEREALRASVRALRSSPALRWVIVAAVLFGAVVSFNHYWAPYFERYGGQMGLAGIWTLMYGSLVVASWFARRLTLPLGSEARWLALALLLAGAGLMALPFSPWLATSLALVVVHELGRGLFAPLAETFVQHRVESGYRATYGSLQSFLGKGGFMAASLVVWLAIGGEPNTTDTIAKVWLSAGGMIVLGVAILYWFRPRGAQ
ncbi:MAG: MFS transporter [Patescibacteria group bacterium]